MVVLNYTIDADDKIQIPTKVTMPKRNTIQWTRVTLLAEKALPGDDVFARMNRAFGIVALRTSNRQIFEQACLRDDLDMISIDTSERLAFDLDPMYVQKAMDNHIYFEVCYAPGIRDTSQRSHLYQVGQALQPCAKQRRLIISSEALQPSEIRYPFDIFYFARSLGLANDEAKATYGETPGELIQRAHKRKIAAKEAAVTANGG
ncbi:RNase P subunit p30-domain-containing protein [Gongronella butleri]|nr:RNase P subunit p30-domain-containing protein [Gongronella butleri]